MFRLRSHITSVLENTGWRISGTGGAAEILGLKRATLQSKIKKPGSGDPDIGIGSGAFY